MCTETDDIETSMIIKCSCKNGFTGDFCEFKAEQDHLLFIRDNIQLFNANGTWIGDKVFVVEQIGASGSCSTVFNGEAIIFTSPSLTNTNRQVQ